MFIHNLDPVFVDLGIISIRWYSLAYIVGILSGWWLGKKIIYFRKSNSNVSFNLKEFDDLITWLIISIIIGGRFGYILFYNFNYYIEFPLEVLKIWQGGMSFHGALIAVIVTTCHFSIKKGLKPFFLLDVIACVAPIGLFFGRIANFINGELFGKPTDIYWSVIFPEQDKLPRHPSQIYEALLEGLILFVVLNLLILKKKYRMGLCSILFLILYGLFRIFSEFFREPDAQIGYIFNFLSMGTFLSIIMIFVGIILLMKNNKNEFNK
jgi:phosphatidylglycerol---prolipoprotein diacylglyceryl transferase